MKYLLSVFLFCSMAIYAQQGAKSLKMKGVYSMTRQVVNNSLKDEILPTKQLKIYTDRYVMYASQISPTDSMASFGIGNYNIDNGKVKEYYFYTAATGEEKDSAVLAIEKSPVGYKQVIVYPPFRDTVYTLTEEYDKVDKATISPLDGAWKLIKSYFIPSKGDPVASNDIEYKVYYGGYFIWGAGSRDSASGKNTGSFGYGTFKMDGSKVTETNTNSTYTSDLVGKPLMIDIKFIGKDSFMQTLAFPGGGKSVETYKRMN